MDLILRHFEQPAKLIFYLQQLPIQTPCTRRLNELIANDLFSPGLLNIDSVYRYESIVLNVFRNALRNIRESNTPTKRLIKILFESGMSLSSKLLRNSQLE